MGVLVICVGFVMCGCFGNMCTCIYSFCIVSFMYIYSFYAFVSFCTLCIFIVMFMYSHCYVYSVFIVATGTLRLP